MRPAPEAAGSRCTLETMSERRYLLRTFGCQMNEHDSERIAGLLTADGYVPTGEAAEANVIVFNTCAIRENADNRLYGNLGHLRPLKERNPRMRIVVAGCLAQKDGGTIRERAPWVDVVVGTHALPELLDLLHRAEPFRPSARSRTTRGSGSRWGVTTPARSASCRSSAGRSSRVRSAMCSPRSKASRDRASSR